MCGVNGVFAYRAAAPAPTERELLAVRDAMAARGPDGAGLWWSDDRRCGFGHRRLAIIDPTDRAAQPMTSADGRYVITYNGEIYNFSRAEGAAGGARRALPAPRPDTEALLHLYALDGAAMVRELRGMFALAIWDEARRGVFLARDPYGIKPLYRLRRQPDPPLRLSGEGAVSRRNAIRRGRTGQCGRGGVPPVRLRAGALHRSTGSIRSLPAGCTQWVDAAGAQAAVENRSPAFRRSWPSAAVEPRRRRVELDGRVRRRRGLDSVRAHLLADVDVGAFLSAGVDSGAMLGLMRDAGAVDLRAITLAFTEFQGTVEDEGPLAAQVAAAYGARHQVRRVDRAEFAADLPAILEAMDQPSIDGVNTWFVAKAAREAGLKVAISGLGGDELLAGYPSFVDLPRWRRRFGALAGIPGVGPLSRGVLQALAPAMLRERPKAAGMLEFAGSWPGVYLLRRALFLPHELAARVGADVARDGLRRLDVFARLAASLDPDPGSDVGRVCALESSHYLRGQLLRDADWAGMAHGVEIRAPLVDIALLRALAPCLPQLRPGAGKAALAAAPSTPLLADIVRRAKTGFSVPTGDWMADAGRPFLRHGPSASPALCRWARELFARGSRV